MYPARGHRFIAEFYADLDYRPDGSLIVTREHDAKDPEEMAARCLRAITEGKGTATDGSDIPTRCETICIHSDTPNAIDIARAVRAAVQPHI
ncbi:MAG: LamB/YcsF family protein [Paracoccaceae bacterium]